MSDPISAMVGDIEIELYPNEHRTKLSIPQAEPKGTKYTLWFSPEEMRNLHQAVSFVWENIAERIWPGETGCRGCWALGNNCKACPKCRRSAKNPHLDVSTDGTSFPQVDRREVYNYLIDQFSGWQKSKSKPVGIVISPEKVVTLVDALDRLTLLENQLRQIGKLLKDSDYD